MASRSRVERTGQSEALLKHLRNPQPALDEIGKSLVRSTQRRITETKESPAGVPWAQWSTSTMLARMRKGTAARGILYDSGNLLNSIQYQIVGKTVQVGVNQAQAPYGIYLQQGTRNMPARPFIGLSPVDQQVINSILRRHLAGTHK